MGNTLLGKLVPSFGKRLLNPLDNLVNVPTLGLNHADTHVTDC